MSKKVPDQWQALPSMLMKRGNVNIIAFNNKLYVFGGCLAIGQVIADCEAYDATDNKWYKLLPLSKPRNQSTVIARSSLIYLIGGYTLRGHPVCEIDVFDTSSESWVKNVESLSTQHTLYISAINYEDNIYIIGGSNHKGEAVKDVSVMKDGEEHWTKLAPLSTARFDGRVYEYNKKLYLIGGRSGQSPITSVDIYDIEENEWRLKVARGIPKERLFAKSVRCGDLIYFLNGLKPPSNFLKTVECFNLVKEEWQTLNSSSFSRADCCAGNMNGYIVIAAGMCNAGPNQATEIYDTKKNKSLRIKDNPLARVQATGIVLQNMFILLGGIAQGGPVNNVEALIFHNT